jgi:hypothetical protein
LKINRICTAWIDRVIIIQLNGTILNLSPEKRRVGSGCFISAKT